MKKNQRNILIAAGLFIMSATQIITHYSELPELVKGTMAGIGIGLMALSFIKPTQKNTVGQ